MLSVGPGSSCDVCFENFNTTHKVPTSIACGHVFCHRCINKISRLCPMCRSPFDPYAVIRLHLDVDSNPDYMNSSPEDMQKVKHFTAEIYKLADEGISETGMRDLINEGRDFLATQDRAMHRDLRILFRLVKFMNNIKISSRDQMQATEMLTAQVEGLEKEKEAIQKMLADAETTRQLERNTALAVEASLRGHIDRIQKRSDEVTSAYLALIQLYNKISLHNKELINKFTKAGLDPGPIANGYEGENILPASPSSRGLVAPLLNRQSLQGVAVQKSHSSYLISPLPQFTSALPNIDHFIPLPELADDDEEEDEEESDEDEEEELSTPNSSTHQAEIREYPARSATLPQPLPPPIKGNYEASGISRTAPYVEHRRRERSRSNPIEQVQVHRRNPPDDGIAPSTPPTPPFTTEADEDYSSTSRDPYIHSSNATSQQQSRQSTSQSYSHYSSRQNVNTPSNSEYPPMPMNEDRLSSSHQMDPILRLQNILSSDPPSPSTSLPSSGSRHFPSSYGSRDRRMSSPPRTGSSSSHTQTPTPQTSQQHLQQTKSSAQHQQLAQQQYQSQSQKQQQTYYHQQQTQPLFTADKSQGLPSSAPSSSTSSGKPTASSTMANMNTGNKMSTASAHAQKIEDERRRKHEEEKWRRQQEERQQAEERERQQQQEHEARYGTGTKYVSASAAAAAAVAAASANAVSQSSSNSTSNGNYTQVPPRYGSNAPMPTSRPPNSNASNPYGRM